MPCYPLFSSLLPKSNFCNGPSGTPRQRYHKNTHGKAAIRKIIARGNVVYFTDQDEHDNTATSSETVANTSQTGVTGTSTIIGNNSSRSARYRTMLVTIYQLLTTPLELVETVTEHANGHPLEQEVKKLYN